VSLALSIPQNALRASQDEGERGFYTLTLTLSQGERGFYALTREQGECKLPHAVMAGLDPAIHVDTRVKPAHDAFFGAPRSKCSLSLLRQAQDAGARARMKVVS
jgi:hypothetical protein